MVYKIDHYGFIFPSALCVLIFFFPSTTTSLVCGLFCFPLEPLNYIMFNISFNYYHVSDVQADPYDSLKDIALKVLQNKVSTVPIIHSTSRDAPSQQLLHLASLSGILKCTLF